MSLTLAAQIAKKEFADRVATVQAVTTAYDNVGSTIPPHNAAFFFWSMIPEATEKLDIRNVGTTRLTGSMDISVSVPQGHGTDEAFRLAQAVVDTFGNQSFGALKFFDAVPEADGEDGDRWTMLVRVPWQIDT